MLISMEEVSNKIANICETSSNKLYSVFFLPDSLTAPKENKTVQETAKEQIVKVPVLRT